MTWYSLEGKEEEIPIVTYLWLLVPDKVKDQTFQGIEMGARKLIDDGVNTSDGLLPLLQTWGEHISFSDITVFHLVDNSG